jgi:predicted transcriptional regulator of viral defense system
MSIAFTPKYIKIECMSERYGSIEAKFLSWSQNRNIYVVKTGDLVTALRLTPVQEARLLSQLSKKRLIAKLIRGLYLVPKTLPPGGVFTPSGYLIVDTLVKALKARDYQISGLTVFNSYGLDTQVSNQLDIYNDKISGIKKIAGQNYRFIKVRADRLGFTQEYRVKEREGELEIKFSSLPRAIFDAIYDCEKFGTQTKAFDWLRARVNDKKFMDEFMKILLRLGNIATKKRVGYVLDEAKCSKAFLTNLLKSIPEKRSNMPLDPTKKARGKINTKWGLILNA